MCLRSTFNRSVCGDRHMHINLRKWSRWPVVHGGDVRTMCSNTCSQRTFCFDPILRTMYLFLGCSTEPRNFSLPLGKDMYRTGASQSIPVSSPCAKCVAVKNAYCVVSIQRIGVARNPSLGNGKATYQLSPWNKGQLARKEEKVSPFSGR